MVKRYINIIPFLLIALLITSLSSCSSETKKTDIEGIFNNPPESAKPWVFWYWMNAAVSADGIKADLEAMKETGIGGAYLMPIMGEKNPPYTDNPIVQLTPEWWEMVNIAFTEAKELDLKLAMHASDGFALAGGPWITPELSMQKIVWADTTISGNQKVELNLPQPQKNEDYYQDIAVYAYPSPEYHKISTFEVVPVVSTNVPDINPQFLVEKGNKQKLRSAEPCWIQYQFDEPFTCRSVVIRTAGNNYQSHRLKIEKSDDGKNFTTVTQLTSPRHGWQDTDEDVTHSIPPTTARYFRFVYTPEGSEPGAEDLDAAKWKSVLKIAGIELSGEPKINQYEGKNGSVWRIGVPSTSTEIPTELCIPQDHIINISEYVHDGQLNWTAPEGDWTILRVGHTSTGHTNYTGGGGLGLECDKFNPVAIQLQFDSWFGEAIKNAGPELAQEVLKIFHVDSWECGSQNWSTVFPEEFKKRRGYDIMSILPVMTGLPINNAETSEQYLRDVRQTISELVVDNFYSTLAESAHKHDCQFTAESVAPTMISDGMMHYKNVDIPMGEFWFRSPTHDKPNDMMDAISGAHVYGKNIVQAEGFTELRMMWDEHPGMLKTLADRNYALGANRFVYHVFTHNPWTDRKPGMTLNGVGLLFQRDQTWWKPGKAWVKYAERCQSLLQLGKPVAQVAVFTGEEWPRRSILPDRLLPSLPGIFGDSLVSREKVRLQNENTPVKEEPKGVWHSANISSPENWLDPLNGYKYDSFNKDALINLASVKDGQIVLPGGACYDILVIPGKRPMSPDHLMSVETAQKLKALVNEGATILLCDIPNQTPSYSVIGDADDVLMQTLKSLLANTPETITDADGNSMTAYPYGKGKVLVKAYTLSSFDPLSITRDFEAKIADGSRALNIEWTHRKGADFDIYFVSNQKEEKRTIELSLNVDGGVPQIYNPVNGEITAPNSWTNNNGKTQCSITLDKNESCFIVLQYESSKQDELVPQNQIQTNELTINDWSVQFDPLFGGPDNAVYFPTLTNWTASSNDKIKYYSGSATYTNTFKWNESMDSLQHYYLNLGEVNNMAEVYVNNVYCGVAWTFPYQVDISKALKQGENQLRIEVTNTWANRLIRDHDLPEEERITWSNVPYRLEGLPLLDAGLMGPLTIK